MKTNKELKEAVLEMCQENHVWMNAFNCINPTKEFAQQLGFSILNRLNQKEYLLPYYYGDEEGDIGDLQKLSKVMYIRINKS